MSAEVKILGSGDFAGADSNISNYSATEYASPLNMKDMSGGVGGISFDVVDDPSFDGSALLLRQPFVLTDPHAGRQNGIIDDASVRDGGVMSITATGSLVPLVSQISAPAVNGTLSAALAMYFDLCGMSVGMQIDPDIGLTSVTLPPWTGEAWSQVKKLAAIYQFEIAEVAGTVVVRKPRLRTIDVRRYESTNLRYGQGSAYHTAEVYYYNNQWKINTPVYPVPSAEINKRQSISVDAGKTTVVNLPVDMWVQSIMPAVVTTAIPLDGAGDISAYSVIDKDGDAVPPSLWTDFGGSITFAVAEDGKSIDATITGALLPDRSPFRIGTPVPEEADALPALYIAASGVAFNRQMISSPTGANPTDAPVDDVVTVDDPLISTRAHAQSVLAELVMRSTGFSQTLDVSATAVNRRGEVGQIVYPTFAAYHETISPTYTFTNFNAAHAGETFAAFTIAQGDIVRDDFENQAFGGVAGARVKHRNAMYRVRSANIGPGGVDFDSEFDTLFDDWNSMFGDEVVVTRQNLHPNPSVETNLIGYAGGNATLTRVNGGGLFGTYCGRAVATATGAFSANATGTSDARIVVNPGEVYTLSVYARGTTSRQLHFRVQFTGGPTSQSSAPTSLTVGWNRISFTVTVPDGATHLRGDLYSQSAPFVAGNFFEWDGFMIEKSSTLGTYFDGDTQPVGSDFITRWAGVPHASVSEYLTAALPVPTFGSYNTQWAGKTFEQHARMPLYV